MLVTSAQAAKLLKNLNEKHELLLNKEEMYSVFYASVNEDPETCRPEYNYESVRRQADEIEQKILTLKHEISRFNLTTIVPGFDMTIDQMLIYIPQLTKKRERLMGMSERLPKQRRGTLTPSMRRERYSWHSSDPTFVDYEYANYDVKKAGADYLEVCELLSKAQVALDEVNSTLPFEVSIEV